MRGVCFSKNGTLVLLSFPKTLFLETTKILKKEKEQRKEQKVNNKKTISTR
jgi:hypothetical protein